MAAPTYTFRQHKKAVSEILRRLRDSAGITQEEAAAQADMNRPHLSDLETGKHDPGLYTLAQLGAVYGVALREMVAEIEENALQRAARAATRKEKSKRK